MLANRGEIDGRRVLGAGWVSQLAQRQIQRGPNDVEPDLLKGFGYGFQTWIARPGTFHMIGAYGQSLIIDLYSHTTIFISSIDEEVVAKAWKVAYGFLKDLDQKQEK